MKQKNSLRVLLSPLDWGLGHATRCIPIIKALQEKGCNVFVACDETAKSLLSREFTNLFFLHLPGYGIHYSSSKRWFALKILQQVPKIITAIRREHKWLRHAVQEHHIDLIISDNRYGLHHTAVPCIFITHQLSIQTPFRWLSRFVQQISYRYINRFSECWVPDFETEINMAGRLSHPSKMPYIPVKYLGSLSRFRQPENRTIQHQWLLIVSGPEPQRTLLENDLLKVITLLQGKALLIRGLPNNNTTLSVPHHCTVFNHLTTEELQNAFAQSEYIVSRSGYTTVMELISLQKKSVLIPTPGQTEQEYLALHLMQQQWCYTFHQNEDFATHLKHAQAFAYQLPKLPDRSLSNIIKETLIRYAKA